MSTGSNYQETCKRLRYFVWLIRRRVLNEGRDPL